MKLSKETVQTLLNYGVCASKDEYRPHLNGVALRVLDEKTLELTACDGFKAIRSRHSILGDRTVNLEEVGKYYIVPLQSFKLLKAHLKENKDFPMFDVSIHDESLTLTISGRATVEIRLTNREYPRIDAHFPQASKAPEKYPSNMIAFSPLLMFDLLKAMAPTKTQQRRLGGLNWTLFAPLSPMYCLKTFEGIEHELILMPMNM